MAGELIVNFRISDLAAIRHERQVGVDSGPFLSTTANAATNENTDAGRCRLIMKVTFCSIAQQMW